MIPLQPHGQCYFWKPEILYPMVAGEVMHIVAYFALSAMLMIMSTRPLAKVPAWVNPFIFLFACFIFTCGVSHLIGLITIWRPYYFAEAHWMLLSGLVSIFTLVVVIYRRREILNGLGAGKILGR